MAKNVITVPTEIGHFRHQYYAVFVGKYQIKQNNIISYDKF